MLSTSIVFLGSGIGGVLRHLFNAWVMRLVGTEFPLGILLVNVLGSLAMGLTAGWFAYKGPPPQEVRLFLTTGIIGGFTTFSAFSLDAAFLYERGQLSLAVFYVLASVILSIAGLFIGLWSVRTIVG